MLVFCLPALLSLAAVTTVMGSGGTTALQGLLAGAPASTPGAIVLRPGSDGQQLLGLLALFLMVTISWPVAGALLVGAAHERGLRGLLPLWPTVALAVLVQLALLGAALIGLGLLAWLAGRIQFQLPGVVLAPGLVLLGGAVLRLSLWPSLSLQEDLGAVRGLRRAWSVTRGHGTRITFAALAIAAATLGPALLCAWVVRSVLDALSWHEVIALSPVTIDAWALAGFLPAALLALVLWGLAARELAGRVVAAAS